MYIAIVRLSALGDIIQSQIVLQFIKEKFPDSKIDWFCDEAFKDVLVHSRDIDNVIGIQLKALKKNFSFSFLLAEYKKIRNIKEYDYIIDLQGLMKSAMISRIIGKKTSGFDKNSLRESIASYFYKKSFSVSYSENVIRRYTGLVSKIFGFAIDESMLLNKRKILGYKKTGVYGRYKKEGKNVVFVLGASWDSKIYPAKQMAEVANKVECNPIVVWGSAREEEMADEFVKLCPKAQKCDKLDINGLIELISSVDLCIGPDTGPTHIAWANNVPSITIFGPTPWFRNTFSTEINTTVDTGKEIDPLKLDRGDFDIRNIDPKTIINKAKELI